MNKNIKYLMGAGFFFILLIAILIAWQSGKKNRQTKVEVDNTEHYFSLEEKSESLNKRSISLLQPSAELYKLNQQSFEPLNYSLKKANMKENLSIIDEAGNKIKSSQSDKLIFNQFSFQILDTDLQNEDNLKEEVKFQIEEKIKPEFYKGMLDVEDQKNEHKQSKEKLKDPKNVIYTN